MARSKYGSIGWRLNEKDRAEHFSKILVDIAENSEKIQVNQVKTNKLLELIAMLLLQGRSEEISQEAADKSVRELILAAS